MFLNVENVYVFDIKSTCIHGEKFFRQFTFFQKKKKTEDLTMKQMFVKVDSRTIR